MLVAAPSAFAAKGFSYGVAAGEISASSAVLWGKAARSGTYTLQVARDKRFRRGLSAKLVRAEAGNDNTVQARVRRLRRARATGTASSARSGAKSASGTFVTAPRPRANATLEFGWSGDTDFTPAPGQTTPYWNTGGVFSRMRSERNDFNIHFGDTIYSDSEVPGRPRADRADRRAEVGQVQGQLGNRRLQALRRSAGFFSHWDDHEFVNDFSPNENTFSNDVNINGRVLYRRGVKAFRNYAPVRWT